MNMEICCGCSSRVLKLQSELRSWKAKLADEKREKRMILKWILAVIGYDVRVDLDKETYGVRVEATENKEAANKAFVRLGIGGTEENVGTLVMELKLEKHEFLEPFEDSYEAAEFPIFELNSMSTTQQPIVNTGISTFTPLSQPQLHSSAAFGIGAPVEVTCNSIAMNTGAENEQEVLYLTGNIEDGTTLEGPNGQSYIIIRGNEPDDMSMQVDYPNMVSEEVLGDGNLYYRVSTSSSGTGTNTAAINYLPITHTDKLSQTHFSLPTVITSVRTPHLVDPLADDDTELTGISTLTSALKSHPKKNHIQNHLGIQNNFKSQAKQSKNTRKLFNLVSHVNSSDSDTISKTKPKNSAANTDKAKTEKSISPRRKDVFEFGLTLREKAEIYVLQKAKEAIEKVPNGFTCNVCGKGSYTYSNLEAVMAHTKSHYESKPYKCDFCDELFSIQKKLLTHRKTVHPKPKGNINHITTSRVAHPSLKPPSEPKSATITVPSTSSPSLQTRTVVLQAPLLDKKDVTGPLSISKEVWEAILRSNSSTIMMSEAQVSNKSVSTPATKVPTIVIASSGSKVNKKGQNLSLSFSSAHSDKTSAVKFKS